MSTTAVVQSDSRPQAEPPGSPFDRPFDRSTVDADSTAVLAFDDGTRIPCDRYILRFACPVIRMLLEDCPTTCAVDERGRTIIPVPAHPSGPFWDTVDVLHGCRAVCAMDVARLVEVSACLDFLGAAAPYRSAIDSQLWLLVKDAPFEAVVPHAARFLANPSLAPLAVKLLIRHRPLWADFRRDVLGVLGRLHHAGTDALSSVVHYAPNFFPPALVVCWALEELHGDAAPDAVTRMASHHAVMYHPCEVACVARAVSRRLARAAPGTSKLLRMLVTASTTYESVPCSPTPRGSVLMYTDSPAASVSLVFEPAHLLPVRMRAARWVKLGFGRLTRDLTVGFRPLKMDAAAAACTGMQLRVLAMDDAGNGAGIAEAWYVFAVDDPGREHTLADAHCTLGDPEGAAGMARSGRLRQLRLDFFYAASSVLDHPFDTARCSAFFSAA